MQSLNGFIAKNQNDDLKWGSSADKKLYKSLSLEYGTVILGKNTYLAMPKIAFKGRLAVVIVRNLKEFLALQFLDLNQKVEVFGIITIGKITTLENFIFVQLNDKNDLDGLVEYLDYIKIKKALVVGGGVINTMFLAQNKINEMHITIAPKIFSLGTPIFGQISQSKDGYINNLDINLTLQKVEQITENEVLLVYTCSKANLY